MRSVFEFICSAISIYYYMKGDIARATFWAVAEVVLAVSRISKS